MYDCKMKLNEEDDFIYITIAITPELSEACLLSYNDFQRLKKNHDKNAHCNIVTRSMEKKAKIQEEKKEEENQLESLMNINTPTEVELLVTTEIPSKIGSKEMLAREQKEDSNLKFIYDKFNTNASNSWNNYFFEEGDILYHRGTCGVESVNQLVLPTTKRKLAIQLAHDSILGNHMSSKKTLHRLTSVFFWPTINKEVRLYCRNCKNCQLIRKQTNLIIQLSNQS